MTSAGFNASLPSWPEPTDEIHMSRSGRPVGTEGVERRHPGRVLPKSYTRSMAKVMVSLPDDLLGALDAEARRRRTSRSALLQAGARHELGLLRRERGAVLSDLDALSGDWRGPMDAAALIRADRSRDG
jgi:hypothetical protein